MKLSALETQLNQQKARIGLTGGRLKLREQADATEPVSAHIDPSDWHVEISFRQNYQPVRDKRTRQYVSARNMKDPLEKMCEDILFHECGHWELPRGSGNGCPYDTIQHDAITEAISTVLKKYSKENLASYVANMFEDVLDNTNCKLSTTHSGQILFWNEQGMTHGKYNKAYEAFVKLNLTLWGEEIDNTFLKRWYTNDKAAISAVQAIRKQWNIPRGKSREDLRAKITHLYQKEQWTTYATQFAEAIAPLLDEPQEHQLFGAASQGNGSGQKANGSAHDKKLATPEEQEKVAHGRYTAGKGQATNRDSFEQLDALYRKLARNIPVEVEHWSRSYSYPLVAWGREQFDPEQHELQTRRVTIGIQDDGTAGININRGWIETEETYKVNLRKFPKFRLALLDTSSSMKATPDGSGDVGNTAFIPWGDNSRYHYALLGYYGIERYLQTQHIAPFTDAGAINFSAATRTATGSGARQLLLTPQFGGTTLDVNVLSEQVQGKETFLLSLSDGDIQNWTAIRDTYRTAVAGCSAAHIQFGPENTFTADLKSWGIPVYSVTQGEDLTRLMVRVTMERYKNYGKQVRA